MQHSDNYFALENVIEGALKQALIQIDHPFAPNIEFVKPFSVEDLFGSIAGEVGVGIIWVGDRVGESSVGGKSTAVYQQWLVVLCVSEASAQLSDTSSVRDMAEPFIKGILSTMQGFDPNLIGYKPFCRIDPGVPVGTAAGRAYFPFLFEAQILKKW